MPSNEAPSLRGLRQLYLWREPVLTPPPLSPLLFLKVLLPPLILPLQLLLLVQLQLLLWLVQPPLLLLQSASLLKLSRWKRHLSLSLSQLPSLSQTSTTTPSPTSQIHTSIQFYIFSSHSNLLSLSELFIFHTNLSSLNSLPPFFHSLL